jgi:aminopeptidase N
LDALLRASLISALGQWEYQPVVAEARKRFEQFRSAPSSLAGNMRRTVLGIVGRNADVATYSVLHELARKEPSTEQKRTLYSAMTNASTPELAQKTMALSITDELLPREATRLVQNVGDQGEFPELAWEFTQANLETLLGKLSSLGANDFVPGVFRSFSEEERAVELETFSKSHLPPQAQYAVEKAADHIRFRAAFKKRLLPAINEWIAARSKTALNGANKQ